MVHRRTVLHIIDSLGRGGAETLLVGIIKATPELNHLIISIKSVNEFHQELNEFKIYQLNLKWYHSLPKIVYQVKQILADNQIDIIHAHLFWSIIVSRLACPKKIKLINSYHAVLYSSNSSKYPFYARLLDKFTYYSRIITLCVSNEVKKNVEEYIGIKKNIHVLYNFIDDAFYDNFRPAPTKSNVIKMVAVGNLKKDKNYEVILEAFAALNARGADNRISLDIFGQGPLLEELENSCRQKNISNISFKGTVTNISGVLPDYNIFIISSTSEGFGLAVVEAMAVGLPALVSDIATLREVTGNNALFFNPLSASDLADKIKCILTGTVDLNTLATQGHAYSKRYTKKAYLEKLLHFYLNYLDTTSGKF